MFEQFRDLEFFRSFSINKELGVLTWGDEIDIAPETLYAEATGTDLPAWMTPDGPASSPSERETTPGAPTTGAMSTPSFQEKLISQLARRGAPAEPRLRVPHPRGSSPRPGAAG